MGVRVKCKFPSSSWILSLSSLGFGWELALNLSSGLILTLSFDFEFDLQF